MSQAQPHLKDFGSSWSFSLTPARFCRDVRFFLTVHLLEKLGAQFVIHVVTFGKVISAIPQDY